MSDVKRLLDEATPLPWRRDSDHIYSAPTTSDPIAHTGDCGAPWGHEPWLSNARLIEYAVNRLPDYEAAVDALERLDADELDDEAWSMARAALARLREPVPA